MTNLKNFILHYCNLSQPDLELILSKFHKRTVKKGSHLLKKGQVCGELSYTEKGIFRHYYRDRNDKEITTWLVFDDMLATEMASFVTHEPTRFYVQAICDSEIHGISYDDLQELYKVIPQFQEFGRKIAEEIMVGAINRVVSFQHETAAVRYERLLSKTGYIQKIPLKYLASFLGLTETSLSRLRRKK